jgi:hypothetical protein
VCLAAALGGLSAAGSGCSEKQGLGEVVAISGRHYSAFDHFEHWAARTLSSDVRLNGVAALREAVFAPLRRDRSVLWAEIHAEAGPKLQYKKPPSDLSLHFVPIDAPGLGRVEVALCEPCELPKKAKGTCVVIARPSDRARTHVRVAYCSVAQPEAHASK